MEEESFHRSKRYICNLDDDSTIRRDTFFHKKHHLDLFVKMDIDGMERKALAAADVQFAESGNVSL